MIDKAELIRLLKVAITDPSLTTRGSRVPGVIEGLLLCSGLLLPNTKYDYKHIPVENPSLLAGFFGKPTTVFRSETYAEHMKQRAFDAIVTLEMEKEND